MLVLIAPPYFIVLCVPWRGMSPMTYQNQPRHRHRVRAAHTETSALDRLQRHPRALLRGWRLGLKLGLGLGYGLGLGLGIGLGLGLRTELGLGSVLSPAPQRARPRSRSTKLYLLWPY
eukprot:scaffold49253_cov58-Phaeocystis_antarctica.AAC.1